MCAQPEVQWGRDEGKTRATHTLRWMKPARRQAGDDGQSHTTHTAMGEASLKTSESRKTSRVRCEAWCSEGETKARAGPGKQRWVKAARGEVRGRCVEPGAMRSRVGLLTEAAADN
ncbi:hypothetical protein Afil01_48770 [Actinorhabdospora filicis]|uniref:Uncharacterized protein n=1 Tax=Actinorhabdospora filicis TaxID=1785913 RepID=A0A9W6SQD1_9ACTN|nr:hypothetical protein Afil01_48770 [Actinorhabdospora filicis]